MQEPKTLRGVRAGVYPKPERNLVNLDIEMPLTVWGGMGSPSLVRVNVTHLNDVGRLVFTLSPSALRGDGVFSVGGRADGKKKRVQARLPESFNAALTTKVPMGKTETTTLVPLATGGGTVTATLDIRPPVVVAEPPTGKPLAEVFKREDEKQGRLPIDGPSEAERLDMDRNAQLRRIACATESIAASLKLINSKTAEL